MNRRSNRWVSFIFSLAVALLLAGCVTHPPVQTAGDALGQSVAAIDAAALSVLSAEATRQITVDQALAAKARLNQAYGIADAARKAGPGSDPNDAIRGIQNILAVITAMLPPETPK